MLIFFLVFWRLVTWYHLIGSNSSPFAILCFLVTFNILWVFKYQIFFTFPKIWEATKTCLWVKLAWETQRRLDKSQSDVKRVMWIVVELELRTLLVLGIRILLGRGSIKWVVLSLCLELDTILFQPFKWNAAKLKEGKFIDQHHRLRSMETAYCKITWCMSSIYRLWTNHRVLFDRWGAYPSPSHFVLKGVFL